MYAGSCALLGILILIDRLGHVPQGIGILVTVAAAIWLSTIANPPVPAILLAVVVAGVLVVDVIVERRTADEGRYGR